ncbi:hypothetical protein [Micromonospora nigra]|uniref:hypothetical protein n=1 Tax=Micromonospora nigra TaxID=145857 RepID=UPI001FE17376|nr:hypothetical protein [Micromonospora nigra]
MHTGATPRMLYRADIGAVHEFMHKFRHAPDNPGLALKALNSVDGVPAPRAGTRRFAMSAVGGGSVDVVVRSALKA